LAGQDAVPRNLETVKAGGIGKIMVGKIISKIIKLPSWRWRLLDLCTPTEFLEAIAEIDPE
jgi:hypothetical protein